MIKASILHCLHRLGYRLERQAGPVDVRAAGNDPRQWLSHPVRGVLVAAPRMGGRIRFYPLEPGTNPFVRAAAEALAADDPGGTIRTVLGRHYAAVQPRRLHDWAGLEDADAPGLPEAPVWAVPEPWTPATLAQKAAAMEGVARRESRGQGRELSAAHGDKAYGPVTEDKLRAESARLLAALDSIRRSGYRRHDRADGDIEALVFLREDGEWRWQVSRGLHRAAVLAALETDPIPVRVRGLVCRGDAGVWPNVVSGLYTRRGAEKMFDRIFDGAGTPAGSGGGPER